MCRSIFYLTVTWASLLEAFVEARMTSCPNWFYFSNDTQQCECTWFEPWGIRCSQSELKIEVADGECLSYVNNQYYCGNCIYAHSGNYTDRVFSEAPPTPDGLDEYMCGYYNRRGLLCGRCIDGYGPAVYSLEMKCADCSKLSVGAALILHAALEFIPITLFFVFVLVTRLKITAGPLLGYVIFCQAYMFVIKTNVYIASYILSHSSAPGKYFFYTSLALCKVWLLQFAWIFTPSFCISSNFTNIHIELLGLVRSIIPVVLMVTICIIAELHKRDCGIIVLAWKFFQRALKKISIKSIDSSAVIHTLASFMFLLTYNLNFALVAYATWNPVYTMDWSEEYRVFSDPTVVWFGQMHFIYLSVLGFGLFPFLVVTPSLILLLYPTRIYRFLSRFLKNRQQLAITAFAEALHSCFKDGLNGTKDYRALAGLTMINGVVGALLSYGMYRLYFALFSVDQYSLPVFSGIIFIMISLLLSYLRPCKTVIANFSLSYHVMLLGIFHVALTSWKKDLSVNTTTLEILFVGAPLISHLFVVGWATKVVIQKIISSLAH